VIGGRIAQRWHPFTARPAVKADCCRSRRPPGSAREAALRSALRPTSRPDFKELVKRHHPDANGGDRTSEDKLREIIEAYDYLKKTGFC